MKQKPRWKIGFIGGGNMAGALIRGFLDAGLALPGEIAVSEPLAAKRRALTRRFAVVSAGDNLELVRGSETVLLAVKPQVLGAVLEEIRPVAGGKTLFVSIAAGFPIARLRRGLGDGARLVRVMPNTPALVGRGASVIVRGGRATRSDEARALRLFRAVGQAIRVDDEALLDPVTGLSGSGPAFVYLFAEALIEGGREQGLPPDIARTLGIATLSGAARMLEETGMTPKELRDMVTSPGGTTLAGLESLDQAGFRDVVVGAVAAATNRSRELGRLP